MHDTPTHPRGLARGYTLALASAVTLSTTAVFIRYLTTTYQIPPLVLAFWRDVLAVLTMLPVLLTRAHLLKVRRAQLLYLAGYGLVFAGFNALWTGSVAQNGAAIATVLVYSSVAFTALLSFWVLHERLDGVKLLVILLALGGCFLVSGANAVSWQTGFGGVSIGLLSGLSYAAYSLLGRVASQRGLPPWTTLCYIFIFASGWLLLLNLLPGGLVPGAAARPADLLWLRDAWAGWGVLALLAAGPTVLGFGLYNMSLVHLPASVVNLVATSEPVFTAVTAFLLLDERLSGQQLLGALLTLAAVVALRLYEGWRSRKMSRKQVSHA